VSQRRHLSQAITRVQPSRSVTKSDITIVLPVFNEECGVAVVIDELNALGYQNILVVDGHSTDMTPDVARSKNVEFINQQGEGKTGAVMTAIEHVSTPYMLVMDADYTYDAHDIERLLVQADHYDQIIGVRKRDNLGRVHRIGNSVITNVFNLLLATKISDVCSGMYLLKTRSAKELRSSGSGFGIEVEVVAQIASYGQIKEVPINYRRRIGTSKLSLRDGFKILSTTLGLAREYNPMFLYSLIACLIAVPGLIIVSWAYSAWMIGRLFYWDSASIGGVSLLIASLAILVGTLSIQMKRIEVRISRKAREIASRVDRSRY